MSWRYVQYKKNRIVNATTGAIIKDHVGVVGSGVEISSVCCAWCTIWLNSCIVVSRETSCCMTGFEPKSSVSWLVE